MSSACANEYSAKAEPSAAAHRLATRVLPMPGSPTGRIGLTTMGELVNWDNRAERDRMCVAVAKLGAFSLNASN